MNIVGKIGELVIEHQYIIECVLFLLLAFLIICLIIKGIVKAIRRKNVLKEINEKVDNIQDVVTKLQDVELKSVDLQQNLNNDEPESQESDIKTENLSIDDKLSIDIKESGKKQASSKTISVKIIGNEDKDSDIDISINDQDSQRFIKGHGRTFTNPNLKRIENKTYVEPEILDSYSNENLENDGEQKIKDNYEMPSRKTMAGIEGLPIEDLTKPEEEISWKVEEEKVPEFSLTKKGGNINKHEKDNYVNEIPKKYVNRFCYIDKEGRVYTEEELKKQIS